MHGRSEPDPLPPISRDLSLLSQPVEVTISPEHFPQIDGYQVLELLGQGGMSSVWKAVQLSTRRPVALKLMGGVFFGNERSRARFEREVELASRLNHLNIARVYDSGLNRGVYYYAMELIEGTHLDQYVQEHQLDQRKILLLMRWVCEAVGHAHTHGVIHRDLKPSNILVTPDGQPYVVDFGLAKSISENDPRLTISQEGSAAGTVMFMSPEQAAGYINQVGTRSDVYSLCVILYRLITGQYPHEATGSIHAIQSRVIHEEPRRPCEMGVQISRDLEALVMKGLARDPTQRYSTASDLANDIERYLNGEVLKARQVTVGYVLAKWLRKHRTKASITAAVILSLAVVTTYAYVRIAQERNYAQEQADAANRALYINKIARVQDELARNDVGKAIDLLDSCPSELRHWEWYYLRGLADQSVMTIKTDAPWVRAIHVNPATRRGMLLSREGVLVSFDLESGQITGRLQLPRCERGAINRSGDRIAIADGSSCTILDSHGQRITTINVPAGTPILRIAFDKVGGRLYVLCIRELKAFDATTGDLLAQAALEIEGRCLAVREDGKLVVGGHGGFEIWDEQLTNLQDSVITASPVLGIALSENGEKIVVAQTDGTIMLWSTNEWQLERNWQVELPPVESLAITADGKYVIVGQRDGILAIYGASDSSPIARLRGHTSVAKLLGNPEGEYLFSVDDDGVVKLWDLTQRASTARSVSLSHEHPIGLALHANGAGFVIAYGGGTVESWDWSLEQPRSIYSSSVAIGAIAAAHINDLILIGRADGFLILMNSYGEVQAEYQLPRGGQICALAIDSSDRWVALARTEFPAQVEVLELAGLKPVMQLSAARPIAWVENRPTLATILPDQVTVGTFSWSDWRSRPSVVLQNPMRPIALIADGGRLILGDRTGSITVLHTNILLNAIRLMSETESDLCGLATSGDGQRLFSAGNKIRVWDPTTGTELLVLPSDNRQPFLAVTVNESRVLGVTATRLYQWTINHH